MSVDRNIGFDCWGFSRMGSSCGSMNRPVKRVGELDVLA